MRKHVTVAFAIACGVFGIGVLSSAAQEDRPPTVAPDAQSPPITVIEDKMPESLHLWHLYDRTDATATVGDEISFVGRVAATGNEVRLDVLKKSAAVDIRAIEPRLRELCGRYNLSYDFDESKLARSWYQGYVAFTSIASTHPVFSTKPVPYATISALYEPVTGRLTGFVFTRRIWQDPPD